MQAGAQRRGGRRCSWGCDDVLTVDAGDGPVDSDDAAVLFDVEVDVFRRSSVISPNLRPHQAASKIIAFDAWRHGRDQCA